MRTITVEEHFATPLFLDGPGIDLKLAAGKFADRAAKLIGPLCDIGDKRIAADGCGRHRHADPVADLARH